MIDLNSQLRVIDRAKDVGKLQEQRNVRAQLHREQAQVLLASKEAMLRTTATRSAPSSTSTSRPWQLGRAAEPCPTPATWTWPLKAKVLELVADCVAQVNHRPGARERHGRHQVARFLVLHKELDPDDDELTRTRKVRRNFISPKRYGVLIDTLYAGEGEQFIETR